MKKIVVISSSLRKNSNSAMLCDEFLRGAREAGHEVEKISLKEYKLQFCLGCDSCQRNKGVCVHNDGMAGILEKMIAADAIVMATPVYFYALCGQLKTLIDRVYPRYTEISGKDFYFIVAAADSNVKNMSRTVESLRGFTACLEGAKERGVVYGVGAWQAGEVAKLPAMQLAFDMGKGA